MQNQSTQPLVSFIIVGWHNKTLLDECFASIQNQTYPSCNIIYVDNGSNDGSVEYVQKGYPKVTLLNCGENLGFAIGNNRGIQKAFEDEQCRYIALLNTDATLAKDWTETLVAFAETHPKGASFQSPTYDYYDHSVLDSFGITVDHYGRAVQLGHRQEGPNPDTRKVFGVNAAAALYSRAFLEAQPFGEDYFDSGLWMYLEDVDLAARATVMGWDNWFVNKSSAYHMGSASSNKNPGFSVFMVYRNNIAMLVKNFPAGILIRIAPRLIIADIQSIYNLWRHRNYRAAKSIVKGRLKGLPMLPKFIRKRRQLRKKSTLSSRQLWRLMKP